MKTYSEDIITPAVLTDVIQVAFNQQNDFFVKAVTEQMKFVRIMVTVAVVMNAVTIAAFVYSLFN
jgi:hypothetical protein